MIGQNKLIICKAELLQALSAQYAALGIATDMRAKGYSEPVEFEITFESQDKNEPKIEAIWKK